MMNSNVCNSGKIIIKILLLSLMESDNFTKCEELKTNGNNQLASNHFQEAVEQYQ